MDVDRRKVPQSLPRILVEDNLDVFCNRDSTFQDPDMQTTNDGWFATNQETKKETLLLALLRHTTPNREDDEIDADFSHLT